MTDDLIKKFDEEVENDPYSFPAFLRFNYDAYQQQLKTVDDLCARIAALEATLDKIKIIAHDKDVPSSFIRVLHIRAALEDK